MLLGNASQIIVKRKRGRPRKEISYKALSCATTAPWTPTEASKEWSHSEDGEFDGSEGQAEKPLTSCDHVIDGMVDVSVEACDAHEECIRNGFQSATRTSARSRVTVTLADWLDLEQLRGIEVPSGVQTMVLFVQSPDRTLTFALNVKRDAPKVGDE